MNIPDRFRVREYSGIDLAHADGVRWRAHARVEKFHGDWHPFLAPYEVIEQEGNLLMTQGATDLWTGLTGGALSPAAYNNANAYLGVGDGAPTAKTGTVAVTNGSAAVVGTGTAFTTDFAVGDYMILPSGDATAYKISVITDATHITLATTYGGGTLSGLTPSKIVGEAVAQTDLQASTNKLRKAMQATYPSVSTNQVQFQSLYATTDANFQWNEWGCFNASAAGHMLNRKVATLGTKTSAASWTLTVTLSLS